MATLDHHTTILLDMDGTVLDLAYDNYFWHELVPRCLARASDRDEHAVRTELFARYAGVRGQLEWYCIDYWTTTLGLDLRALKAASSHRVRYLPGAQEFLLALRGRGRRVVLVTNAHQYTLHVKRGVAGLDRYLDHFVSSHDLGVPKEHPDFWHRLEGELGFERATTLFVDDSPAVLHAAAAHGIGTVIAMSRPDSGAPSRAVPGFTAVESLAALLA
jgi:putative hydrolase of the HAD superfamily